MTKEQARRERYEARCMSAQDAVVEAERRYRAAVGVRDRTFKDAHGAPRDGHLSYQEIADQVGLSKGRVIQIVRPPRDDDADA